MTARVETIEGIAWRGLRLRLWCFGCARTRVLDAGKVLQLFATRRWDVDLAAAALRFPCSQCRSASRVIILPASQPRPAPLEQPRARSWADEVAAFFHGTRAKRKEKPLSRSVTQVIERMEKRGPGKPDPRKKLIDNLT